MKLPRLTPAIAERLDDEDYPVQDAVDFLQDQLDSGVLEGINGGAVCVVRDGLYAREVEVERLWSVLLRLEACLALPLPDDAPSVTDAVQIIHDTLHPQG